MKTLYAAPFFGMFCLGLMGSANATIRENEIDFGADVQPGITQYDGAVFTETEHFVSPEDSYEGISAQLDHGIVVRAGLSASPAPAMWMVLHSKAPFYDTGLEVPEDFQSTYFSLIGDLRFIYFANSHPYVCKNIGLMYGKFFGDKSWAVFSNIAPGLFTRARSLPVDILCVDQNTRLDQKFVVTPLDTHHVTLQAKPRAAHPEEFSDEALADTLMAGFNSIPSLADRNQVFSNGIYRVGGANNFVIHDPHDFSLVRLRENAHQTNIRPVSEKTLWTDVSELPNETPVNQTFNSTSHSLSVTNSVTTESTKTLGGSVGGGVKLGVLDILGLGLNISGNYSYSWGQQVTTATTEQYTTPAEPILVPPYCKAVVSQSLSQATFEGTYEFEVALQGYAKADGMAFWNGPIHDPVTGSDAGVPGGVSAPTSYQDSGSTAGRIDIYETIAHAANPQGLDPRVSIDRNERAVLFKGAGRFSAAAGTYYMMRVRFEPTRQGATCSPPNVVKIPVSELRSTRLQP